MKKVENYVPCKEGDKRAFNFINLVGKKFNLLTVIEFKGYILNKNNKRRVVYLTKCDCGNQLLVRGNDLKTNSIKSCSCHKRKQTILFNKTTKTKVAYNTFSAVWQSYKKGAKDRGLEYNLSKKIFYDLTQGNCYYCGTAPKQERKPRCKGKLNSYIYNGIDRKDSVLGYTVENCVPCCGICNKMKSSLSISDFIEKIEKIYFYTKKLV